MLKFARHKLTSVYRKGEDRLSVHGVLEDDIYGLEIDLDLSLSGLEVLVHSGALESNGECGMSPAVPILQEAVGFRIDQDFTQKVQKIVGRKACRHFADLVLECGEAARDAAQLLRGKDQEPQGRRWRFKTISGRPAGRRKSVPVRHFR